MINEVLELRDRTVQGRKLVLDAIVAAHGVPRRSEHPGQWVAAQWTASADLLDAQKSWDDLSRSATHEVLDRLRGKLSTVGTAHPLYELFEAVSSFCSGLYRDRWVAPELKLKQRRTHPGAGQPRDPYSVSAQTVRYDGEPAQVRLEMYLPEFGPESYAVLPRLLMHECFCHAVAGHPVKDNRQDSVFAEGWMDWAAAFHFPRWFDEHDREFAAAANLHAGALTQQYAQRDAAGRARVAGHDYASGLARWFSRQPACRRGDAERATARLALEVNLTAFPLKHKDLLTRSLGATPVDAVQPALRGWLRGSLPAEDVVNALVLR